MKDKEQKKPSIIIKTFIIDDNKERHVRVKSKNVKNANLTHSSRQWLSRHINDEFTQKSKAMGYRARSAFKLVEIQEKFGIIKNDYSVLDLGCAPGSWSEVAAQYTKKKIIGIDLLETKPLPNAIFLQGDFLDEDIQKQAIGLNIGKKFDVIVSDIAPNTTGSKVVDHLRIMQVLDVEMQFIMQNLITGGNFIAKVFQGEGLSEAMSHLKTLFQKVQLFKPKASRRDSKEIYIVCLNFI